MAKRRLNAPFRTALVSTTHATSRHLPLPVCSFFFCLFFSPFFIVHFRLVPLQHKMFFRLIAFKIRSNICFRPPKCHKRWQDRNEMFFKKNIWPKILHES
ncbi:hypothetical protein PGIGA_G00168540 [Pangasianodon gigas]|uniref:Uncharacterized protein n=1 Tax=Pangasianodon gigas TaxID=30993 RepID=A0ACC5XTC4_PANGG|nr:hypothetical protein [Pangasianodon gigas]